MFNLVIKIIYLIINKQTLLNIENINQYISCQKVFKDDSYENYKNISEQTWGIITNNDVFFSYSS